MSEVFKIASQISTPIALTAFTLACVLWIIDRAPRKRKISDKMHVLLLFARCTFFSVGLLATAGHFYIKHAEAGLNSVYRVRATAIGTEHTQGGNPTVWCSTGEEAKK